MTFPNRLRIWTSVAIVAAQLVPLLVRTLIREVVRKMTETRTTPAPRPSAPASADGSGKTPKSDRDPELERTLADFRAEQKADDGDAAPSAPLTSLSVGTSTAICDSVAWTCDVIVRGHGALCLEKDEAALLGEKWAPILNDVLGRIGQTNSALIAALIPTLTIGFGKVRALRKDGRHAASDA